MPNPVTGKTGMPGLDTPIVDLKTGNVLGQAWYKFLIYLLQVSAGAGQAKPSTSVMLQQTTTPGLLVVTDALSQTVLGHITLGP